MKITITILLTFLLNVTLVSFSNGAVFDYGNVKSINGEYSELSNIKLGDSIDTVLRLYPNF